MVKSKTGSKTQDVLIAGNIKKIYHRGSEEIAAVNDISLTIKKGEFVSFVGPSGSGKTTLINILGCLDNPTSGNLNIAGREIFSQNKKLSENELTIFRRELFGYIFQNFYLIPTLTVYENIAIPLSFYKKENAVENIYDLLKSLGIDKRANHLPGQLSGGEMQRVAIARALVNKPEIILADEPTGNLDTNRTREIGSVLRELNRKEGITLIMVTHNPELAKTADRVIELQDGKLKKKR
jgi:putative ABC transport system ATP-binding protein